ncbi:unnamed protein product [Boreogadus saida]
MVSPTDPILLITLLTGYHAVGSNVTLRTGYGGNDLFSVEWYHGEDLAVTLIGQTITIYRNFKDRIILNRTNGDLTIIGVTESESGEYTVYLNGKGRNTKQDFIKVIHYVPVPTVTVNCSIEDGLLRVCHYTCAGNTSQSEPVSYEWSSLNPAPLSPSNETIKVTMESLTGPPDQWFCTMKNPVSKATATVTSPPRRGGLSIVIVLTVILALILELILAVIFICVNRLKTGVWIWKKEIWEKRKDERNGSSKDGTKYGCPKPLLNQTENNLEPNGATQLKATAV